jgi:hypothetical protein
VQEKSTFWQGDTAADDDVLICVRARTNENCDKDSESLHKNRVTENRVTEKD